MALTDSEKLSVTELLGLVSGTQILDYRFANLTAAEETRVRDILTAYSAISLQATSLNVDGYKRSDYETEFKLKQKMALLMGIASTNAIVRRS